MVQKKDEGRIIITFSPRGAAVCKVEFENMDAGAIAPQLVVAGEFLAFKGREIWAQKPPEVPKSIMPPMPRPQPYKG